MPQEQFTLAWSFWMFWSLAFLGFPIGGLLAHLTVGPITNALRAGLAGAITGAVIGLGQWLVLGGALPLSAGWILATSAGMAIGMGISAALLGTEPGGNRLLWRAGITGLCIGSAQWFIFRQIMPGSVIWIALIGAGWVLGWFVTRSAGVDLSLRWPVFGATGALAFQFLTGLALYFMVR